MSPTPQQLTTTMANKTTPELQEMFAKATDWTPDAIKAASAELLKRGIPVPAAAPPPPNLDYEITASGRKRYLKATTFDILISICIPGWGVLVGFMAFFKGEGRRAMTMIILGLIPISIGLYQRFHLGMHEDPHADPGGWILIPR